MVDLKRRRVGFSFIEYYLGQSHVNEARGKEAKLVFFEEAGSFKSLSGMDYTRLVMGEFHGSHTNIKFTFPTIRKGHRTYELNGRVKTWTGGDTYFIMAHSEEELSVWEQAYLKYGDIISEDGPRRSGRTTRIIDRAISTLIQDGRAIIMDHHPLGHEYAFRDFCYRMKTEHPEIEFELEVGQRDDPKIVFITNV